MIQLRIVFDVERQANYLDITEKYVGVGTSLCLKQTGHSWPVVCEVISGYGNTLGTVASWVQALFTVIFWYLRLCCRI